MKSFMEYAIFFIFFIILLLRFRQYSKDRENGIYTYFHGVFRKIQGKQTHTDISKVHFNDIFGRFIQVLHSFQNQNANIKNV